MLTVEDCKRILQIDKNRIYSNEEIKQMRAYLYELARLQIEMVNDEKDN